MTDQADSFVLHAATPQGQAALDRIGELRGAVETIGAALEGLIVQLVEEGVIPPDLPDDDPPPPSDLTNPPRP